MEFEVSSQLRGGRMEGLDDIPHIGDTLDHRTATWLGCAVPVCPCHLGNTIDTVIDTDYRIHVFVTVYTGSSLRLIINGYRVYSVSFSDTCLTSSPPLGRGTLFGGRAIAKRSTPDRAALPPVRGELSHECGGSGLDAYCKHGLMLANYFGTCGSVDSAKFMKVKTLPW